MEMDDHYAMSDLRHFLNPRPQLQFPSFPQPTDLFSGQRNLPPDHHSHHHHHYDMMILPSRGLQHEFRSDSSTTATATSNPGLCGLETETVSLGGDGGTARWPRQETLTLLEIRSRLDHKFKEANQKGPLWDEVSRIMSDEHGYQRSGKKCREKFENLYKYYKKTKEGKAGRQDGKHYRFFRQLEALYGETSNPVAVSETHLAYTTPQANQEGIQAHKLYDSLSLSNSSEFDTSSSDYGNDLNSAGAMIDNDSADKRRKRRGRRSWKTKITDFIDSQMKKLMDKQEAWLDRMLKTLEQKEKQRMLRDEEWRKQEAERSEREHKFWAKERAWIESRDAALMTALQKVTGRVQSSSENQNESSDNSWPECEITRLIQLRTSIEPRVQQSGCSEEALWDEIAAKMCCLGYERSALMCKDKWDRINSYLAKTSKKRKENSRNASYFQNNESLYNQGGGYCEINEQDEASPSNSNAANTVVPDSCFPFMMADGENLWDSYNMKISKGENHLN